jgi:hypothetical protein
MQSKKARATVTGTWISFFVCPCLCHDVGDEGGGARLHKFPTRWNRILSVVVLGASVRRSLGSPRIPETSEIRAIRTLRFSETALDLPYGHSLILYTISPLPILSIINMVRYIKNLEEFEALMDISNTKLVVVDFTAGW